MSELTVEQPVVAELTRRNELATGVGRLSRMLEIRCAEDLIKQLFADGLVAGTTHTCQGQEAVAVGIASVLRPTDLVSCTYRGHGHALALGMRPDTLFAEILGRQDGCVGGLGGSMHLSDARIGLTPTTAIVGAGVPIAAGLAWASTLLGTDDVAVGLFGDGASNIGAFHEGLNLAAVWRLPVIFICENNLYGEYSPVATTTAVPDVATRAAAYQLPGEVVDGQDLDAVIDAVSRAVGRARSGEGATLLEMKTYRFAGHSRSDPASYRPAGELEAWLARDPIGIARERLITAGEMTEADLDRTSREIEVAVTQAAERAKESPASPVTAMFDHVQGEESARG
jgi:TPP-dependent pyruvate/acetoin dehydrogenase alpha subunit